jgi:hypothetical protein
VRVEGLRMELKQSDRSILRQNVHNRGNPKAECAIRWRVGLGDYSMFQAISDRARSGQIVPFYAILQRGEYLQKLSDVENFW